MNYLAHAYLSFNKPEILTGNLIADFVKGKKQFDFSPGIQAGIVLHRAIDQFTDHHKATHKARDLLKPACGPYSGVFMDVVYDHFLARDDRFFEQVSLKNFSQKTYQAVGYFKPVFPERFERVFYYMQRQDWLAGYYYKENIFNAFRGIYTRAKFLRESDDAFSAFEQNYTELQDYYASFIPDIVTFVSHWLDC
jgi:acyl carrier protein phosphodiesterase